MARASAAKCSAGQRLAPPNSAPGANTTSGGSSAMPLRRQMAAICAALACMRGRSSAARLAASSTVAVGAWASAA